MASIKYDPKDWESGADREPAPDGDYQMKINSIFYNVKDDGTFPRYTVLLGHTEDNAGKFSSAKTTLFLPTEERPDLGRKLALFLGALGVTKEDVMEGVVELDNDGKNAVIKLRGDVIDTKLVVNAKLTTEERDGVKRSVAAYIVKAK